MNDEHHTQHSQNGGEHHGGQHDSQHAHQGGQHHNGGMPEIPKVDMKNVNATALKGGFHDILAILKLDKGAIERVAHRESEGINLALVYLAIGAVAGPLGGAILGYSVLGVTVRTNIVSALIGSVVAVVMGAVVYYVTSLVAEKLFKGHGKFPQYFRVMGYASLLNVAGFLTVLPLAMIVSLWLLVVNYMALTVVHKLDTTNAVLTLIVTVLVFFAFGAIVAGLGLSAVAGLGSGLSSGFSLR